MKPKFSIILPIYNQSAHLPQLFEQHVPMLNALGETWELLFIVNGSKDDSYKKALELAGKNENIKIHELEKGGWGRAVKYGIAQAKGEFICYTNSARTSVEDLSIILNYARTNDNIVIKTTRVVRESFVRKWGSVLYNYENRVLLKTPLWDVNGTPKVIPSKFLAGMEIHSEGDLIDAEIMARIFRKKAQIVEVLILSSKRIGGKSTTGFRSAMKMYMGLFGLKKILGPMDK